MWWLVNALLVAAAWGYWRWATRRIREQQRRLREHVLQLKQLNGELDQLATLKDDFLAIINHQLRTPLTPIIEGLELVRDGTLGPLTPDQRSMVQVMDENAGRLAALIEEVLDLSLLKSGRRLLDRAPGDLAAMLERVCAAWRREAGSRTLRLECPALPPVYMDGQAVEEVLQHLLRNALRHAPEGSEILVEAQASEERAVEVAVRDRGPGMTTEQLGRLFQPFVHIQDAEAPGSRGSGLGLAFCRQALERHRGTIRAEVNAGGGMTFAFTLPVASTAFLFEEACRSAKEDAEYDTGGFAVLLVGSPDGGVPHLDKIEALLRAHTHHGDRFVRLDGATLAVVAITAQPGLDAMVSRLRGLLAKARLDARLATALAPMDGDTPESLLVAARRRLAALQPRS